MADPILPPWMTGVPVAPAAAKPATAGSSFAFMLLTGVLAGGLYYYLRGQSRQRELEAGQARALERLEELEAESWGSPHVEHAPGPWGHTDPSRYPLRWGP